ncbi:MAG: hypothetical protein ACRBN8_00790 [Nannocystales bacterium]
MALTRLALGLAATALTSACGPAIVHRPDPSQATPTHVTRVETQWVRTSVPAEGVTIAATLWDASLVASALAESRDPGARRAWAERYLDRTAFTIVIELEDRQPVFDPTPLLDPQGWSFSLALNKGQHADSSDVLAPSDVDLLLVDRFPTDSGDYHHRVAMAVFFEGTLHDAAQQAATVALVVKPQIPKPEHGRGMLGASWARRGARLQWRVEPHEASDSSSVDH